MIKNIGLNLLFLNPYMALGKLLDLRLSSLIYKIEMIIQSHNYCED